MIYQLYLFLVIVAVSTAIVGILKENIIISILAMSVSFICVPLGMDIEIPHAAFVDGGWQTYQQVVYAEPVSWIMFMLGLIMLINWIYLALQAYGYLVQGGGRE